jgi:hypothetical protein
VKERMINTKSNLDTVQQKLETARIAINKDKKYAESKIEEAEHNHEELRLPIS